MAFGLVLDKQMIVNEIFVHVKERAGNLMSLLNSI